MKKRTGKNAMALPANAWFLNNEVQMRRDSDRIALTLPGNPALSQYYGDRGPTTQTGLRD
jgi:hypothetical protein